MLGKGRKYIKCQGKVLGQVRLGKVREVREGREYVREVREGRKYIRC